MTFKCIVDYQCLVSNSETFHFFTVQDAKIAQSVNQRNDDTRWPNEIEGSDHTATRLKLEL